MRELHASELSVVGAGSEWGDNVLDYGGAGAAIGTFFGPKGTAIGMIAGAVVGTIVTIVD